MALLLEGDDTIEARKDILKEQREQLLARMEEMQKTLDILNHKIQAYEGKILETEKKIKIEA